MRLSTTRVLILAGLVLALGVVMNWARQFVPGSTPSVVEAQTKGKEALDAARLAFNQATSNEKLNPTKESALATDAALEAYNAAVGVRILEINAGLKDLEQLAAVHKTSLIVQQIEALEAERSAIQAPSGPTPTVTPETEPNGTSATANTINVSATSQPCAIVSAAINPGGDLDFFTFTGAPAGSRIWIETDTGGTQNAGATSRDTVIDLLAADGTTVIENDDDDGTGNGGDGTVETGLASMIGGRTLTAGGTYFIRVRGFSATGIVNPYRLFVTLTNVAATPEVEANNTAATANTIVTGGSPTGLRSGAIVAGDADYYSVVATAGNSVYFNVDADPERDGTGTDLVVEFRDPADVLLLSVDSSITGSLANPAAEGANFTITTSGTYFIKVRHFSATGTGTYHIMVSACSGDAPGSPIPTIVNETEPNNTAATANVLDLTSAPCAIVAAAINPGGDLDFFTFTGAPAGSRIWIETDTGGTQNAGATSRDTVIDLLAADGTTVIENDDDDGTGNGGDGTVETGLASMIGGKTLTAGGTYFIRVRAFSATGIVNPYRLFVTLTNVAATAEVEANNTAATANSITTGSGQTGIRSGAITPAADADYYSVVAVAGNIVYFNCDADPERDGTGTDLVVEFRDPADVLLLSVDSSITGSLANPAAEGANFSIGASGTYFVKVRHFSATGTGTYHLMVSTCSGASGGGGCSSITCPANVTQTNDPNQCGAVVTYTAPTPNGSCGTINCSPASGSFFPVGTTTVTCTSSAGPTCQFTVTVTDDQPPSITCPPNQVRNNDPNQCGAVVNYPPPTITDNCPGTFTATCNPPSGSFFPVGTTTVTCTVDGFRAPQPQQVGGGACSPMTITQSTSQAITPLNSVSCNDGFGHTDNSYWRAFTLSSFGITNAFDVQSVDVGIEDAISGGARPPIKGATKGGTPNGASKSHISHNARANAPAGGGQPITVNIYTSSMPFPAGFPGALSLIGTASVNVADQSGTILNVPITGTAGPGSQLVVEVFTPDGTAVGNLFFIGSNAAPETGPSYLSAADCGVNSPTTTAALGFPGMHIVLNVTGCQQSSGTGPSCTFTVTVNDTQPPVITCPANITAVTDQNACPAPPCQVVNFTTTGSDNCPGVTVVCNPPSGSCFPVGVTTVTCTATDASGNTATCTFTVTTFDTALQDDSNPAIILLWNSITGSYRFCCNGVTYTGVGKVQRQGCLYLLDDTRGMTQRVLGRVDKAVHAGTASVQAPPGTIRCTITDRNTLNDTLLPACQ